MKAGYFCLLLMFTVFVSCNRAETTADSGQDNQISYGKEHADKEYHSTQAIWSMEFDTSDNSTYMRKLRNIEPDTPEAGYLIYTLNRSWPQVPMKLLKKSNDTLYVKIKQSEFLTQQMGSAGAEAYMATATYTLTEDPQVQFVNFDFPEGDHAIPGTYKRGSFKNIKQKR